MKSMNSQLKTFPALDLNQIQISFKKMDKTSLCKEFMLVEYTEIEAQNDLNP